MAKTADEKLALIEAVVELWIEESNDEEGDRHLSDADLAMEVVDAVLRDVDPADDGNLRQFMQALANRRI